MDLRSIYVIYQRKYSFSYLKNLKESFTKQMQNLAENFHVITFFC